MYVPLLAGYVSAALVIAAVAARHEQLWPRDARIAGLPLALVLLSAGLVLVIGELWRRGLLIPADRAPTLARAANQALIFAPVFAIAAMLVWRGRSREAALMPVDRVHLRLGVGVAAALIALGAHHAAAGTLLRLPATVSGMARPANLSYIVQILGEDVGIAMLLASLLRHVRPRVAIIATGVLFAAGHVPAMITDGQPVAEFTRLVADGLLSAGVVALLLRVRDIWVIWPVHVTMDLTQFY